MKKFLGEYVEITFKSGLRRIGKIPTLGKNPTEIIFLPYENEKNFNRRFGKKTQLAREELSEYMDFLNRTEIENITKLDTNLKNIKLENGKQLPNLIQFILKHSEKPGHIGVEYKIDDFSPQIDLGEHPIIGGEVTLPMKLVFISYAKEDLNSAIELMKRLHDKGILTWFDKKDLLPGDLWEEKIETAIETSDFFIVLFSSNTLNKSGYKQREIEFALEQKSLKPEMSRYIIPILLDDCTPPRRLRKIHWIKRSDNNWFNKLLLSLGI